MKCWQCGGNVVNVGPAKKTGLPGIAHVQDKECESCHLRYWSRVGDPDKKDGK